MNGYKAAPFSVGDEWIIEWHWDIFWKLIELQGYDKERVCPKCGRLTKFGFKDIKMGLACTKCRKSYSPTAKTIFANSKLWLPKLLKAVYLLKEVNSNMTLADLKERLHCTNVTACNLRRKIKSLELGSIEYRLMLHFKYDIIKEQQFI